MKFDEKHLKAMLEAGCTFTVCSGDREPSADITEGIRGLLDGFASARKKARTAAFKEARKAIDNMDVVITRFKKRSADMNGWHSAIEQAHKAIEAAASSKEGG